VKTVLKRIKLFNRAQEWLKFQRKILKCSFTNHCTIQLENGRIATLSRLSQPDMKDFRNTCTAQLRQLQQQYQIWDEESWLDQKYRCARDIQEMLAYSNYRNYFELKFYLDTTQLCFILNAHWLKCTIKSLIGGRLQEAIDLCEYLFCDNKITQLERLNCNILLKAVESGLSPELAALIH
jgi:hypothetical protein